MRGGSEVRPVWVPCPLPSLGSHKLACCNSLPDGLAPAGVCLYIRALTGGCEGCNVCDLRCWECSLGGSMQPKYAYPLCCHKGHVDKDNAGRRDSVNRMCGPGASTLHSSCVSYLISHKIQRLHQVQLVTGMQKSLEVLSNLAIADLLGKTIWL